MLFERGVGVGIYLGQMPPAELARLKAEIAETLIANFSYPRFYDYRVQTLRMRPVDRAKRQEVWTFLSSFDFNTISRIDIASPDFQRQVERLLILFVQRNRAFFGQQGRKRMSDVRALISSSSASVTEGLRGHLSDRAKTPFGNARPVISWSKSNGTAQPEPGWEQIASSTLLLQQQLQEVRGEIRPGTNGDARPAALPPTANGAMTNGVTTAPPRRSPRLRATTQASNETVPSVRPAQQDEAREVRPSSEPLPGNATDPLVPQASVAPAPAAPVTPAAGLYAIAFTQHAQDRRAASNTGCPPAPQRELTRNEPLPPALAPQSDSAKIIVSDEDVAIFEEMRHQMIVWLRVEVVRAGVELSGQPPAQLLEILGQQEGVDETRLQIVSTLLGLANQVIANGRATLVEYKQAMMFYLIHTRRAR